MKLLFRLFGPSIHRYLAAGSLRPSGFNGMEFAFSGLDGHAYYTWTDIGEMTPTRQKHIERCMRMSDAGIGQNTLDELCDLGEAAIMEAVKGGATAKKSNPLTRATYIFGEIRNRPRNVIPEEVYYDIAALFAVRDDEDPRSFDAGIHGQKIQMLRDAGAKGHDFFDKLSGFKRLLGSLLTTEHAFIELLSSWTAQRAHMEAIRHSFGSGSTTK